MREAKGILIDAKNRRVSMFTWSKLDQLYKLLGGFVGPVRGDNLRDNTLYVDDDGMLKPQEHFFLWNGYPQPLAGNGVIVGRELEDDLREHTGNADCTLTVDYVVGAITWMTRAEFVAWTAAQRRPAVTVSSWGGGGPDTAVLNTWPGLAKLSEPKL